MKIGLTVAPAPVKTSLLLWLPMNQKRRLNSLLIRLSNDTTVDMFEGLIGQDTLKSRLHFYSRAKEATGTLPFLLFNGAKGLGKTEFAKSFAKSLGKPMIEINCSTIRNAEQFFEQVFIPAILDKDVTVLLDEAHALPKDLEMAFLTIFNIEGAKTKRFEFGESSFLFEFERQTFLFATTELDKLFPPFKDRLTQLDFEPYNSEELAGIIQKKMEWIDFGDNILKEVLRQSGAMLDPQLNVH
jgi:Holliday junction resolvasome RuvABC ATP-dependent DNA helicase subunit